MSDVKVIDMLLLKSRQEYQETMNCWKTVDHVMGIMLKPQVRPKQTFLQKFYEGEWRLLSITDLFNSKLPIYRTRRAPSPSCCYRHSPPPCSVNSYSNIFSYHLLCLPPSPRQARTANVRGPFYQYLTLELRSLRY